MGYLDISNSSSLFMGQPLEFWLALKEHADETNTTPLYEEIGKLSMQVKELRNAIVRTKSMSDAVASACDAVSATTGKAQA